MVQLHLLGLALVTVSTCIARSLTGPFGSNDGGLVTARDDLTVPGFGAVPRGLALKVMPVGDSITAGKGSTDWNGYRLNLKSMLESSGQRVSFVGSQVNGDNNNDNHHEGYPLQLIRQVQGYIKTNGILRQQRPNLVLLHVGTNDDDMETPDQPYAGEAARLGTLIDYLLCTNPKVVILVAKLIQNKFHQNMTDIFNAQIPGVVAQRAAQGYKVRVVDMSPIGDEQLTDQLHPNDAGYHDMAQRWYTAIREVPALWWPSVMETSKQDSIDVKLIDACDAGSTAAATNTTSNHDYVATSSGQRSREVHGLLRLLSRCIFSVGRLAVAPW